MAGKPKDKGDPDPTLEQEFFIGGWDPYVVELTRLKRDAIEKAHARRGVDRRANKDRRKG